jgi:hypothetical protein
MEMSDRDEDGKTSEEDPERLKGTTRRRNGGSLLGRLRGTPTATQPPSTRARLPPFVRVPATALPGHEALH